MKRFHQIGWSSSNTFEDFGKCTMRHFHPTTLIERCTDFAAQLQTCDILPGNYSRGKLCHDISWLILENQPLLILESPFRIEYQPHKNSSNHSPVATAKTRNLEDIYSKLNLKLLEICTSAHSWPTRTLGICHSGWSRVWRSVPVQISGWKDFNIQTETGKTWLPVLETGSIWPYSKSTKGWTNTIRCATSWQESKIKLLGDITRKLRSQGTNQCPWRQAVQSGNLIRERHVDSNLYSQLKCMALRELFKELWQLWTGSKRLSIKKTFPKRTGLLSPVNPPWTLRILAVPCSTQTPGCQQRLIFE